MSKRILLARWASVLGLALAALPAVNCFDSSPAGFAFKLMASFAGDPKASVKFADHAVFVRGRKRDDGFTVRSERELWPPFRVEGTLALLDPKHDALGPFGFGLSVISPQTFAGAGATLLRSGDGVQVTADVGGSASTTLTLSTALAADVAIVHDGTNLVVSARGPGDVAYQELGRVAAPLVAYQVSLDGSALPYRTLVAYDDLRVVNTSRRPGLTPIDSLKEDVYVAADALADALELIDGPTPDAADAATRLATARDDLAAVVAEEAAAGVSTKSKKTIAAAQKKVLAALAAVQKGKKPKTYFNLVYAAAQAVVKTPYAVK